MSLDLAWIQRSKFNDATIDFVENLGGPIGAVQHFEKVLVPGFDDTLLPRAGIEYLLKDWTDLRSADEVQNRVGGGYYFLDSPVPNRKESPITWIAMPMFSLSVWAQSL